MSGLIKYGLKQNIAAKIGKAITAKTKIIRKGRCL